MAMLLSHLFASELCKRLLYLPCQPLTGQKSLLDTLIWSIELMRWAAVADLCPASPLGVSFGFTCSVLWRRFVARKPAGKSLAHGEPAVSLVIRCAGDHFVKSDMKIRMVPKRVYQYYSSLNLPTLNFWSISEVRALSLSTPSFSIGCLGAVWRFLRRSGGAVGEKEKRHL